MIDLHVHTTASDGSLTPEEVVNLAEEIGLNVIAITDHDTVDGCKKAIDAAAGTSLRVIPGIEFSSIHDGYEIHILGYNIDIQNRQLIEKINFLKEKRLERNKKFCENLTSAGYNISLEELNSHFLSGVLTRANMAVILVEKGYAKNKDEAFNNILSKNLPYYVKKHKIDMAEAISLIKNSGGTAVLAHPVLYKLTDEQLKVLFIDSKNAGIEGVEAIYSKNTSLDTEHYKRLAAETGLFITGGSDFHGSMKNVSLGTGYGNLCVPDSILDNLEK